MFSNKLYILGGFNINVASTNQIWQFDPTGAVGAKWLQRVNTPVGIMYAPTATIGNIIYVGGASDYVGGTVIDTTNSFSFNPGANTIGTIAAIPRATGETRGLTFNGKMLVMGGGRVAPNPSTEVDAYNPATNTWTVNTPVPAFRTARRNFPTDTDGTSHIWLAGGYASDGITPLGIDGNLLLRRRRTIADTNSDRYSWLAHTDVPARQPVHDSPDRGQHRARHDGYRQSRG